MADLMGGWYLNNKGVLEYRKLDGENLTTTVLASVAGLANLKAGTGEDAEKVLVKKKNETSGETEWKPIGEDDIKISDETVAATATDTSKGTIEIGSSLLGTSKITVTGNKNLYTAYLDIQEADDKVHIEGTEGITYNNAAGTAVVTGDLSKGFTLNKLDGTATQATYSDAKTNQTLATVSGLAKNYDDSTVVFKETDRDDDEVTAGTITLFKADAAGEVSALGTTAIKVAMSNIANANGIAYYLDLGEDTANDETYAQVAANDEPAYWTVKGTTATYQYVSPTGYTLKTTDGKATQVNVTAAKTTVVATVTGLAADLTTNITDKDQYPKAVGTGQARFGADGKDVDGETITDSDNINPNQFVSGITITADVDTNGSGSKPTYKADGKTLDDTATNGGKGSVTINISKVALPTSGTVTVTAGKDFNVSTTTGTDFLTNTDATADDSKKEGEAKVVKDQLIWVVSGNKAIYEKVDLAYYEVTDKIKNKSGEEVDNVDKNGNKITRIICTPQGKATVLATISGLDADYLADESNLVRGIAKDTNGVITHIKGINATNGTDAVTEGKTVKKAAIPGEIVLSKEVLGTTNVSLAKSDNYRLALATEANSADGTIAVDLPKFSDYKWNLVGTTATLKGTVTAGYTASDDGKTITYTAAGVNQTLATVSGLKKGTQLNKGASDARTIGNEINGTFTAGVVADTTALSHKTIEMTNTPDENETKYNIKALNRLPITLSKHVMDGKVTLNSNFFTLAINQDIADGATLAQKADSRTYVIEKYTDGVYEKNATTGKDQLVTNADAIVGWHGSLGSTAILKQTAPACYELVTDTYGTTKTINYTAVPKTTKTLATIKGLNSAITEDDIEVGAIKDSDSKIPITIKSANALTTGNVTITSTDYKLALATKTEDGEGGETVTTPVAGLGEATLKNCEWSQATNGTVSFKATVTGAGYKLNADQNIITYTKEASTATTLATITGLRAGLLDDESDTPPAGVTYNETDGIITLSRSALGTAKSVVLSGAGNYKLEVDSTIGTTEKTDTDAADRWVISGTNAILKKVIPDYYTLNGNTLTHIPETDVKYTADEATEAGNANLKGKSIVYGTIQGLKSGLTVDADGKKIGYYKDGVFVPAITVADKVITINDAGVLDNKNSVKLDKTATDAGYTIELSSALVESVKPSLVEGSEPEWTVSKGTATYKGKIGAGYANSSDNKSIVFSAANNNATIATITGLNTTLTNDDVASGLTFGTDHTSDETSGADERNIITVNADMLGTTDAKLTTNIAILGKDYKLALDDEVPTEASVKDDNKNIWTIDSTNATSTTATYGTWKDTHYSLNKGTQEAPGASDTITYYKAGVADTDKIVTVTGLAGNLVTIKDGQIRGIATNDTDNTITLSSSVLPTTVGNSVELTNHNENTYGLALDANEVTSGVIPTPQENVINYKISKVDSATVTITKETSAGFVYDGDSKYNTSSSSDKTKLVYKKSAEPTGNNKTGTITGLSKNISNNDDGTITGITIKDDKIVLSKNVLAGDVTLESNDYTLELGEDVKSYTSDPVWEATATKGTFNLYAGITSSGYTLEEGAKSIKYKSGGDKGALAATVTGLKNTSNLKIEGTTITISAGSLNAQNVTIKKNTDYTGEEFNLALNTDESDTGYVAESKSTKVWTLTNGTATFTQNVTAGYKLVESAIIYTAPINIVSTFTNFNKALTSDNYTISEDGTMLITKTDETDSTKKYGIQFVAGDEGKGTFTITDPDLLAHKNVKLTTKATGTTADYTIELGDDVAADVANPVWNKAENATVATYTQTTAAGYSLDSNSKNIVYSSDPTTVTLATVSGLNKESVVGTTTISSTETPAIGIQTDSADPETFTAGLVVTTPAGTNPGVITISGNVLNNAKVTLGKNDDYTLKLYDATNGVIGGEKTENGLVFDKSTGTMSITTGDAAKWEETTDGKSLKYTKDTYKNAATITGLPKNLTYTEAQAGNTLAGITIGEADGDGKIAITIEKSVVSDLTGGSKITLTNYPANGGGNYTLDIGETNSTFTSAAVASTPAADHKKWVASTKNLTLKEVTSAHYLKSTDTKKNQETITYVAEKVGSDLAVITGLPTDIKTDTNGTKVYLSDGSTELFTNKLTGTDAMEDNKITITDAFIGAKDSLTKALTINLASKKSTPTGKAAYVFDDTGAIADSEIGPKKEAVKVNEKTFETTSTKGTAILQQHTNAGWERVSDTQIKFTTASDAVVATFNGLNKNFTYKASGDDANASAFEVEDNTVTLKDELLTNSNVTVTMPKGATTPYTLELGSDVATEAEETTSWAVSGGTATYKTYDQAYYTTKYNGTGKPNSIIYNAPSKGTAYASITGLNKTITSVNQAASENAAGELIITLGANELEGTTKVVLANGGAKTVAAGRNMTTQDDADKLNTKIKAGNATSAKFKLALDISDSSSNSVTASGIENAVWDNNGKVATLTGTITKGYRLSNDQKTITYQSADSRLQTIAKVTGIKSGSQISDTDVAALDENDQTGRYNENLPNLKYITLGEEHLGTDNVVLTGEGYKLALDAGVIEASEEDQWKNQTEWVNNNGTFVYKTYNKGYYTLDENTGMRVNYTAAKDDTKTAGTQHKTYLTISGLSKTATPTLAEAGDVEVDNSTGAISVTTKADGVITLTDAELNKANVKLTDSQNGGYSLALGANVTKSTVSNDSAVISGTKATWTGTQGKGYLLANDEQNVTYYSAAKTKQTIATVTGLASGITSAKNDEFSGKYDATTNTVSLGAADLGDKVTVGGTAAFSFDDDYTGGYVTGSNAADKMTFAAGGNSINAGGGNDVIDVASKGSNVFFYANGNGNDVIKGFTAETDSIKVTNVAYTKIEISQDTKIEADALVKVNNNIIRLKDVTATAVKVYAQNDTDDVLTKQAADAAPSQDNIFADDNYAMTPNLSSIVKSSTASYATDDLTADDATALTKQSTAISYSDKK